MKSLRGKTLRLNAALIIADDPVLVERTEQLKANGYDLQAIARGYPRRDGDITVQFVWQKKAPGVSISVTHTVRYTPQ